MQHATPWSTADTCAAARDAYLRENGWTLDAYDAPRTEASVLGIAFSVPNTPNHAWAIRLHDLHHVATGYGTDAVGEGEVSAWELSRGLAGLDVYVGALVVLGTLYGFLRAPRRTWRALRSPGACNLFTLGDAPTPAERQRRYEQLLALDVAALRTALGVPAEGLAPARGLHSRAPRPPRRA